MRDIESDMVHLARLAVSGRSEDVRLLVRKLLPVIAKRRPDLESLIQEALSARTERTFLRSASATSPLPVDLDSRLELLKRELPVTLPIEPRWPSHVTTRLGEMVNERKRVGDLTRAGLVPTRTALFVGPPGVGKTLAARWLAREMGVGLLTLDLSAVMSSFLGRTGNNIRVVLDYARRSEQLLLLDEFDAIAKRRDDSAEIGELKRLVTVILQEIETWPTSGLLIAATNHPDLLDPAVWRRFDVVIEFPMPAIDDLQEAISGLLATDVYDRGADLTAILASVFEGTSYSDVSRELQAVRRKAFLSTQPLSSFLSELIASKLAHAPVDDRVLIAKRLISLGFSQRLAADVACVSRETLRQRRKTLKSGGRSNSRRP